jgi:DNA-binding transcriptional LysR family regulator
MRAVRLQRSGAARRHRCHRRRPDLVAPLSSHRALSHHRGASRVRIHVEAGFDEALLRALRRGELDLVVAEIPSSEDRQDIEVMALTSDRLGVCCRRGHPIAKRQRVNMRDLQYPWIKPPHSTCAHRRLDAFFVASDLPPPKSVLESASVALQLNVLRQSDALARTVSKTLETPEGKGLVMLEVPGLALSRDAGVITGEAFCFGPQSSRKLSSQSLLMSLLSLLQSSAIP